MLVCMGKFRWAAVFDFMGRSGFCPGASAEALPPDTARAPEGRAHTASSGREEHLAARRTFRVYPEHLYPESLTQRQAVVSPRGDGRDAGGQRD